MQRWIMALGLVLPLGAGPTQSWSKTWSFAFPGPSVELGVRVIDTTPQLRRALAVTAPGGVLILEVEAGSPADKAGLRAGDVVTRVAGSAVAHYDDLVDALRDRRSGDAVDVEYVRQGKAGAVSVTLAAVPTGRLRRWSFSFPDLPLDAERELRRFRERVERRLRDLEERLRRLEGRPGPERT